MKKRQRFSSCKITAKRIINEKRWDCVFAALLIVFPRLIFVIAFLSLIIANSFEILSAVTTAVALIALLFFSIPADAFFTAWGELNFYRITEEYFFMNSDTSDKISARSVLKKFGIKRLVKLRLSIFLYRLKDILISAMPLIAIIIVTWLFVGSYKMPVFAFAVTVSGLILITVLSLAKIALEKDKYHFIYNEDNMNSDSKTSLDLIKNSSLISSQKINFMIRYESGFLRWDLLALLTLPLIFPAVYVLIYKKLVLNIITFEEDGENEQKSGLQNRSEEKTQVFRLDPNVVI